MSGDYSIVTELPGNRASAEQLSMIHTRYHLAGGFSAGKDVLEVACGPGRGLGYLARVARSVVGGDLMRELVAAGNEHYGGRPPLLELDAQALPFSSASFDVVLLFEAIYYLRDPRRFVAEARRVLRPGGVLLVCTANCEWPDFNPSPFSASYLPAAALRRLLVENGFSAELFAGFPIGPRTVASSLVSGLKRAAVSGGVMPKSMKGKALLKRLFFGPLSTLGPEIDTAAPVSRLERIGDGVVRDYKVIYAVARLS